jgi:hypothetical protein
MDSYCTRGLTLDPGRTALALRALHERNGHYPFLYRLGRRRPGRVARTAATLGRVRVPSDARSRPYLVVVRRGETEVFRRLVAHFQGYGEVTVIWDRRQGDRRVAGGEVRLRTSRGWGPAVRGAPPEVGAERRGADRRVTPAAAWEQAKFVLVPRASL